MKTPITTIDPIEVLCIFQFRPCRGISWTNRCKNPNTATIKRKTYKKIKDLSCYVNVHSTLPTSVYLSLPLQWEHCVLRYKNFTPFHRSVGDQWEQYKIISTCHHYFGEISHIIQLTVSLPWVAKCSVFWTNGWRRRSMLSLHFGNHNAGIIMLFFRSSTGSSRTVHGIGQRSWLYDLGKKDKTAHN